MTITKKTRLLPVPFVGTRIKIKLDDPESLEWGMDFVILAEECSSVTIDWGDGTMEQFDGTTSPIHAYPRCGTYEVVLSDDLTSFRCSNVTASSPFQAIYAKRIVGVKSNARKLDMIPGMAFYCCENLTEFDIDETSVSMLATRAFYRCTGLMGALRFPAVTSINAMTFTGCTGITELHFGKVNEATLRALPAWESSGGRFGAENATVYFDL